MKRQTSASRDLRALDLAFGVTVAAIAVAAFCPAGWCWGINWYSFLPRYSMLLLVVAAGAVYFAARWLSAREDEESDGSSQNGSYTIAAVVVIALFTLAFVLWRTRTHFLGDGYQVLAKLESGVGVVKPWNVAVHLAQQFVMTLLSGASDTALRTFQIISIGSGLLAMAMTAIAARALRESTIDRLLFLIGVAVGGYSLLYFGYVEYYPLFVTACLIFLLLGMMTLEGRLSPWWTLIPLVLAGLCHPYAVALLPPAGYLYLRDTSIGERLGELPRRVWIWLSLGLLVVLFLGLYSLSHLSYFLRFAFVPIIPDRFTLPGYSMFSIRHLGDIVNLLFMLVPSLLLLLMALGAPSFISLRHKPSYRFLALAVLGAMIIVMTFDPRLGMPRDWDLFSFAGLPLVLLLFHYLTDSRSALPGRRGAAIMAIALGLFVLIPRVVTQANVNQSIAVFDSYSTLDPMRNDSGRQVLLKYLQENGRGEEALVRASEYKSRMRHEALARLGREALDRQNYREAEVWLRQAIEVAPNQWRAWAGLGSCCVLTGRPDSAEFFLKVADGLNPFNADIYEYLGLVYFTTQDYARSEDYCNQALAINPDAVNSQITLLQVYRATGRTAEYRERLFDVAARADVPPPLLVTAAGEYLAIDSVEQAARLCLKALEQGADSSFVRALQEKHPELRVLE